jgi:hypothetical protein
MTLISLTKRSLFFVSLLFLLLVLLSLHKCGEEKGPSSEPQTPTGAPSPSDANKGEENAAAAAGADPNVTPKEGGTAGETAPSTPATSSTPSFETTEADVDNSGDTEERMNRNYKRLVEFAKIFDELPNHQAIIDAVMRAYFEQHGASMTNIRKGTAAFLKFLDSQLALATELLAFYAKDDAKKTKLSKIKTSIQELHETFLATGYAAAGATLPSVSIILVSAMYLLMA